MSIPKAAKSRRCQPLSSKVPRVPSSRFKLAPAMARRSRRLLVRSALGTRWLIGWRLSCRKKTVRSKLTQLLASIDQFFQTISITGRENIWPISLTDGSMLKEAMWLPRLPQLKRRVRVRRSEARQVCSYISVKYH